MIKTYAHHTPSQDAIPTIRDLRERYSQLHELIEKSCPDDTDERHKAFERLQESLMWAIKTIVLNDRGSTIETKAESNPKPVVISPSIGRKIWYWGSAWDKGQDVYSDVQPNPPMQFDSVQPCDATVIYVHNDRLVNLLVVDHNGNMHTRTSVQLVQPGDACSGQGRDCSFATWMPYQIGRATKSAS